MIQARRPLRWGRAATAAGLAAVAAATGCSQPSQSGPPVQAPLAGTPQGGPGFKAIKQGNHLVCDTCGTQLNAQGRHRLGAMLVKTMRYMSTRDAFSRVAGPNDLQLKTAVNELIGHIGHQKLGFKLPTDPKGAPGADPVNQFPVYVADKRGWQDYVMRNPYGCCLPDGVPAPDAPF